MRGLRRGVSCRSLASAKVGCSSRFLAAACALWLCTPAQGSCADPPAYGYIEPYKTYKLSIAEAGILSELPVKEGERVSKGQLLARLDTRSNEAEIAATRSQLHFTSSRFEKYKQLQKEGRLSPEEFQKAQTELEIEHQKLEKAEAEKERRIVRSPANGIVVEIKRNLAEGVTPVGPPFITVVELDSLALQIYTSPEVARRFKVGDPAQVQELESGLLHPCTIEFVSPVTDAASNTVRVKAMIPNPEARIATGVRALILPPNEKQS